MLACLVLHAGQAVSADRLLHDVWGDELPASGTKAVAYQIFKLRGVLEPAGAAVIVTTTAGYCLELPPDRIDVHVFDELIDRARHVLPSVAAHVSEAFDRSRPPAAPGSPVRGPRRRLPR